jgi:hypothetical protein
VGHHGIDAVPRDCLGDYLKLGSPS